MPLLLRYLDRGLAFFFRYVLKYRLEVIRANLKASFAYPTPEALESDVKSYYRYLARIIRQVMVRPKAGLLQKRMRLDPSPQLDQWLAAGQSVIVTFGHSGNWEWTGAFIGMKYPYQVCALYKKIKSKWVNDLMYARRVSHTNYLFEMRQMGDLLRLMKTKPVLILMISDQNPGSDQGIIWTPFLGKDTAFINGPEKLAIRYHLPVVYIRSISRQDGGYDLACIPLYDGKEKAGEGEIIRRYAAALEENIRAQRTTWLWSHKRWKRNPYFYTG